MPHLLAIQQHRPLRQPVTPLHKRGPQDLIGTAIADAEPWNAGAQLTQLSEVATKGAAAIEDQQRTGGRGWRGRHRGVVCGEWGLLRLPPRVVTMHASQNDRAFQNILSILSRVGEGLRSLRLPLLALGAALALAAAWLPVPVAWADSPPQGRDYRCGGDPLRAELVPGAVDAVGIPNTTAGTLPGAYLVLRWRGVQLQLPRTNNAGPLSFSDGKWAWSQTDPDHPLLRLRRPGGDLQEFPCEPAA